MTLQEVMEQHHGHSERLPADQLKLGSEIQLPEFIKTAAAWREIWQKLDGEGIDQLTCAERHQAERSLKAYAKQLEDMTFKLKILDGSPAEWVRISILRENSYHPQITDELFQSHPWWMIYAYGQCYSGGQYLDFCHVNTMEVVRIWISWDSPIINSIGIEDPPMPGGVLELF